MSLEQLPNVGAFIGLLPVVAITVSQARAIYLRDGNACSFPHPHICKRKLSIHHIQGKEDRPENLITVCQGAHWDHLHNGYSDEVKELWQEELSDLARERTADAVGNGWQFPLFDE